MTRNILCTLSLAVVCALCVLTPTAALYEEQAGLADWHVSHVGGVSGLALRPSQSAAVVRTSENVLAAIGLTSSADGDDSGDVRWRQVMPQGESLTALASYSGARVVTVSATAAQIGVARSWSSKDGNLIWETTLADPSAEETVAQVAAASVLQKQRIQDAAEVNSQRAHPFAFTHSDIGTIADVNNDGKADVVAMHGNKVYLLSGVDGVALWSWSQASFVGFRVAVSNGEIAVIGQEQADSLSVYTLKAQDGSVVSSKQLSFAPVASTRNLQLVSSASSLLLLDAASQSLTLVTLFTDAPTIVYSLADGGVSSATYFELIGSADATSFVVVVAGSQQALFAVDDDIQQTSVFTSVKGADVEYAIVRLDDSKPVHVVKATLAKGRITIESFAIGSTTSTTLVAGASFAQRGGLKQIWVDASGAAGRLAGVRVLISCVDDSLSLFRSGSLEWTREEALASLTRLQFVELPVGSGDVSDDTAGTYPNAFERIVPQLRSLVSGVVSLLNPVELGRQFSHSIANLELAAKALAGESAPAAAKTIRTTFARPLKQRDGLLTQDYFGFRKLILARTESGKVYALESESGQIVWAKFLRPHVAEEEENEEDERVTPVWKLHVLSHHEAVAIVNEDDSARASLIAFNPLTGDLLPGASVELDFLVSTSLVLPHIDSHNRRILLVAPTDASRVRVLPNTAEVRHIVAQKAANIFFYTVDTDSQVLRGFNLRAQGESLTAVQTWVSRFPVAQERIVSIAARPANEVIQSSVRVLGGGDGGYLYKYLNPNLLAIATVRSSSSSSSSPLRVVPSLKRTTDPSVNLYLLDTITGAILDKFVHRGCEGPVTVAQTENTILYHYFNAAAHQYELSSVELFESRDGTVATGPAIGNSGVVVNGGSIFDGLTLATLRSIGRSTVAPFNSFEEAAPQSLQQTFTFRTAIKSIGVTQTRRGITMKEFLIGLPSDQLYAMPKLLVDPRRPTGEPTPLDRAEGLIPYSAELPIDPLRIVSHLHTIGHLKSITSSHALLESTSLVCTHGIDLFCGRLTPSQTFDLLNEDFNSPFLIATVTAVFAAIVFTRRLARAKELKAAWK